MTGSRHKKSRTRRTPTRDRYDKIILNYLDYKGSPATTLRISRKTMMSWPTAKEHLSKLNRQGRVSRKTKGNKIYWWR